MQHCWMMIFYTVALLPLLWYLLNSSYISIYITDSTGKPEIFSWVRNDYKPLMRLDFCDVVATNFIIILTFFPGLFARNFYSDSTLMVWPALFPNHHTSLKFLSISVPSLLRSRLSRHEFQTNHIVEIWNMKMVYKNKSD